MRTCLAVSFAVVLTTLIGCSGDAPVKSEPVDVTVTITLPKGQPGRDLQLVMFPTSSSQLQGGGKTDANGKVKTKLTPGKYTFGFDGNPTSVPKKYHSNSADHTVEVSSSSTDVEIKLTD